MSLFSFFDKKPTPTPPPPVREVLFGDVPVQEWPRPDSAVRAEKPWALFGAAQDARQAGDVPAAVSSLREVIATPGLESRHYLQAWQFLRELGIEAPAANAKQVLGVVLEVVLEGGLDLVAAYADNSARYFNYSGKAIVWEGGTDLAGGEIQALLAQAQPVAAAIGPWKEARPGVPPVGQVRINLLTPSGLHFGQGDFGVLFQDPMGGPILARGQALMQALIELKPEQKTAAE
jgi:hypothetical protein